MKVVLPLAKRVEIANHLKEVLTVVGEKVVAYPAGVTDQSIADKFGCNDRHVKTIRTEMFGLLAVNVPATPVEQRLLKIEATLDIIMPMWRM